jgi:uncharacterized membrane protein YciS (DUF1049 family)
VIALIIFGLLLLVLVVTLPIGMWVAARERWQQRVERAYVDRQVRRAERQLHGMATQAMSNMLGVARSRQSHGCEGHR